MKMPPRLHVPHIFNIDHEDNESLVIGTGAIIIALGVICGLMYLLGTPT